MRTRHAALLALLLLAAAGACATRQGTKLTGVSEVATLAGHSTIAEGIVLFPGTFEPGRQPDGNSVVIDARDGLVVFDTGRHREHTQRLLDHARRSGRPVAAIVNSHWHLDHSSGNRLLRAAYPQAQVVASGAVDAALAGFLADSRREAERLIAKGAIDEPQLSDVRGDIATIAEGRSLLPTMRIEAAGERAIGGRTFRIGLAPYAVTAGDLWLYEPATRVLLAGDLVTLPAPLFDTACVDGWRRALDALEAIGFERLVPGHGMPMDRAGFRRYRAGFDRLLACAASDAEAEACADRWLQDLGDQVPASQQAQARALLGYYLPQVLRAPAVRRMRYCSA